MPNRKPSLPRVDYHMPLGRTIGYAHAHPERTASWHGRGAFADVYFHEWRTREAMARFIRRWEQHAMLGDTTIRALVPLGETEGY